MISVRTAWKTLLVTAVGVALLEACSLSPGLDLPGAYGDGTATGAATGTTIDTGRDPSIGTSTGTATGASGTGGSQNFGGATGRAGEGGSAGAKTGP